MKKTRKKSQGSANMSEDRPVDLVNHSIFYGDTILSEEEAKRRNLSIIRPFGEGAETHSLIAQALLSPNHPSAEHYQLKNVMRAIRRRIILTIRQSYSSINISQEEIRTDYDVDNKKDMEQLAKDLKMDTSKIKSDPEKAGRDIEKLKSLIAECNMIERIFTPGDEAIRGTPVEQFIELGAIPDRIGYGVSLVYGLGEEVMKEKLWKPAQRKYKSTGYAADEWGKIIDDHYNAKKAMDKKDGTETSEKMRVKYAYDEMDKDFKKEYPNRPELNNDTKRKYWKMYNPSRFKK